MKFLVFAEFMDLRSPSHLVTAAAPREVCGVKRLEDAKMAIAAGANLLGVIFATSRLGFFFFVFVCLGGIISCGLRVFVFWQ